MLIPESELMQQARRALSERRVDDAQGILVNLVIVEPRNDEAWVLLAETLSDPTRKMECLERARRIDPHNPVVQDAITLLKRTIAATAFRKEVPLPESGTVPLPESGTVPLPESSPVPAPEGAPVSSPAPPRAELATPLLEYADTAARAVIMATEPATIRTMGLDLVHVVERARQYDETAAQRWSKTAGHGALVKYERALTTLITNLPHNDSQLATLRAQRQRALDLLK